MGIYCKLTNLKFTHGEICYGCLIENTQPPENRMISISKNHEPGKTDNDVILVTFTDCNITKVPQDLTWTFQNLKNLVICNSKLKKICQNDLIQYKNLEIISIVENELEYLPGNLFEGFVNLNYINFKKNKLSFIEPNVLDGLKAIKYVDFSGNPNYEKCFSIYLIHAPNATLDEVKMELINKFYTRFNFLKEFKLINTNSKNETQDLKNIKAELENEIQQLKIFKESLKQENQQLNKNLEQQLASAKKNEFSTKFSNFNDDFVKYFQDEKLKNLKITIDGREFLVHKFLMIVRSPTFAEMLQNNSESETINLVDVSIETFEKVLKFLYTDELPNKASTNFMHLFAAAGKLKIQKLKDFAAENLNAQIDSENALDILNLSNKYDCKELNHRAFEEIKTKYPKINFKNEWIENPEKLQSIIEMLKKQEEIRREFENQFQKMFEMD